MNKINLKEKLTYIKKHWDPKIIAEVNDMHVKLAKLKGDFTWHFHENEDELFYVVKGELVLKFRDKDVLVKEGELIVVPHGVEHKPVAEKEVHIMLFEPRKTLNTGNVENEKTKVSEEWI